MHWLRRWTEASKVFNDMTLILVFGLEHWASPKSEIGAFEFLVALLIFVGASSGQFVQC